MKYIQLINKISIETIDDKNSIRINVLPKQKYTIPQSFITVLRRVSSPALELEKKADVINLLLFYGELAITEPDSAGRKGFILDNEDYFVILRARDEKDKSDSALQRLSVEVKNAFTKKFID